MNISLASSHNKKILLENFCVAYRRTLLKHTLFATETTGLMIEKAANLQVNKFQEGLPGVAEQLCTHLSHKEIDLVIYLIDSDHQYAAKPKSPEEILNILRYCAVFNIPFAPNLATAEALLNSLDKGKV